MVVQIAGQITYGFLDTTAGVLHLTGAYLANIPVIGPPIGNFFDVIGDVTQNAAYAVAKATHVGPYSTSG
ncbi:hypothetical protein CIW47_09120 [Mycolicibacterium sp. P1-5]|nr:hypothetical protein CIW47_09120 [Mycolicibacterium sp. P1-5]